MGDTDLSRKLYNKYAGIYISAQEKDPKFRFLRRRVYSTAGSLKGRKVLFAGCGPGFECVHAVKKGANVTGIDVSDKLIEHARRICPKAEFHVADFEKTGFRNSSFDVVISILATMYKKNLISVLKEFNRLVGKNGNVIIAVPHPIRKMVKYNKMNYFVRGKRWENWQGIRRFNYYTLMEDYINSVYDSGFKVRKMSECSRITETKNGMKIKYPQFIILHLVKG